MTPFVPTTRRCRGEDAARTGSAAVVRGEKRAHIGAGTTGPGTALWVLVDEVEELEATDEIRSLAAEYKKLLLALLQRREAWQIVDHVNGLTDPSALADTAGYASYLTAEQKRQLLETTDVAQRLRMLVEWMGEHLAEVEVNDKIAEDVRAGMDKQQKEFLLRQQLAAIRKDVKKFIQEAKALGATSESLQSLAAAAEKAAEAAAPASTGTSDATAARHAELRHRLAADQAEAIKLARLFLEPANQHHLFIEVQQFGIAGRIAAIGGVGFLKRAQRRFRFGGRVTRTFLAGTGQGQSPTSSGQIGFL